MQTIDMNTMVDLIRQWTGEDWTGRPYYEVQEKYNNTSQNYAQDRMTEGGLLPERQTGTFMDTPMRGKPVGDYFMNRGQEDIYNAYRGGFGRTGTNQPNQPRKFSGVPELNIKQIRREHPEYLPAGGLGGGGGYEPSPMRSSTQEKILAEQEARRKALQSIGY